MKPNEAAPSHLKLARRMSRIKASAVREILKVTERPDILSFAGGLPAPELFPVQALAQAHAEVFQDQGAAALQYSTTEGFLPLRAWISEQLGRRGIRATPEQVLITNGSQQGIDLVSKILLDPGDTVVVENPSYLAALQVFESFEAKLEVVGSDDEGMRVDELEQLLRRARPKLIYLVPTFQNPKGTTLSLERRERLARLARDYDVPVIEDDPYGELRYRGSALPPVAALDRAAPIIYLSTFSKTLSPGLRIGWAVGSLEAIRALTIAKQAADLHTSTLVQRAVARMLETFDYEGHLGTLRRVYGDRCQGMLAALEKHFPSGTTWTRPDGGLFLWAGLPENFDTQALLADAVRERVAFVPGAPFFAQNPPHSFLRLNFSNQTPAAIEEGMRRLGSVLSRALRAEKSSAARVHARADVSQM